jgi:hypothetical protein
MHIETKVLEGRDHFVVPVILITEGVHSGSRGPVYYPAEELRRSAPAWNGKPLVVYHPDMALGNGYACNPNVFNRQKIGTLFNTRFVNKALKAEAWIDVERVRRVDGRVLNAIQKRQMMEVSTGLTFPLKDQKGTWNGENFVMVATNIQADHLAVLPDRKGACSIADGAGLIRNILHNSNLLRMPAWSFAS